VLVSLLQEKIHAAEMSGPLLKCKDLCACCGSEPYEYYAIRVVCVECEPNLYICLDCFAGSVLVGGHKASHQYRFEENETFPIMSGNWSSKELFQLLEGLEQFGYGNWNDVSRYVDTKGPTECRDMVNQSFVDGPIGSRTYSEDSRGNATDHTPRATASPVVVGGKTSDVGGVTDNELLMVGWLPNRDEYEVEHFNSAETLVSSLDQGKNAEIEEDVDIALKLAHVEMYQAKLKERGVRKQTAANHGLIKQFFLEENNLSKQSANKVKSKKDGKAEALEKLKVMSNFQTVPEHQRFIASISRERDLKSRIKELNRYRKNGIRRLKEGEEFDVERLRRNKVKMERKRAQEMGLEVPPSLSEHPQGGIDLDAVNSIVGLPGYELLSGNEKRLCASLRLHPHLYTAYKTCLIRDHIQKRRGQIIRTVHPSGLEKSHRIKIFQFLLQAGWISAY